MPAILNGESVDVIVIGFAVVLFNFIEIVLFVRIETIVGFVVELVVGFKNFLNETPCTPDVVESTWSDAPVEMLISTFS